MSRAGSSQQIDDQAANLVYTPGDAWQQTTGVQGAFDNTLSTTNNGNVTVNFKGADGFTIQCLFVPQPLTFTLYLDDKVLGSLIANLTTLQLNGTSPAGVACATVTGIPNPDQQHSLTIQVLPSSSIDTQQSNFTLDSITFTSPDSSSNSSNSSSSSNIQSLPTASSASSSLPAQSSGASSSSSSTSSSVSKGAIIFSGVIAGIVAIGLAFCLFFFIRKRRLQRKSRSSTPDISQFGNWSFQNSAPAPGGGSISVPPKSPHYIPTSQIRGSMAGSFPIISQPLPPSPMDRTSYVPQPPRQAPPPPVVMGMAVGTPPSTGSPVDYNQFPIPPQTATSPGQQQQLSTVPNSLRSGVYSPGHSTRPSQSSSYTWV